MTELWSWFGILTLRIEIKKRFSHLWFRPSLRLQPSSLAVTGPSVVVSRQPDSQLAGQLGEGVEAFVQGYSTPGPGERSVWRY